LISSSNLCFSF